MSFLAPQALWLLLLLPLVVALHFLRARRRRYEVAGLFLWRRAQRTVARRRRFSPTWLLVAQLLFVGLAAVAMAQPVRSDQQPRELVLIVDASASMAADSQSGGRLTEAKAVARSLLDGYSTVALIRAGLEPRLLAPLDSEPAERLAALGALTAADASADLLRAVDLGRSLLPSAPIHVITDHERGLGAAEVHVVGEPVGNVGISAFDLGVGQAFVALVASGARPEQVEVGLWQQGRELARGSVLIPRGGSGSITFPLSDVSGVVEARLVPPPGDALALDDVAYAGSSTLQVVSNDSYPPLIRALGAVPHAALALAPDAAYRPADLRVLQRASPAGLPPGNYLLFPPPAAEPEYQLVRAWERTDPLLRFVDLRDTVVGLDAAHEPWPEEDGWRVLARSGSLRPLLRVRSDADGTILQSAFHLSQSDLVLRPAFPALIANLLSQLDTTVRLRLGETLPGGAEPALAPGVYLDGQLQESETGSATVVAGGGELTLVSLLAAGESRLPRSTSATVGLGSAGGEARAVDLAEPVPATNASDGAALTTNILTTSSLTTAARALLLAALAALLVEWLLFAAPRRRRLVG